MHLGYFGEREQTVQSSEEVNGSLVGAIVFTEVTKERHHKSKQMAYQQEYQFVVLSANC